MSKSVLQIEDKHEQTCLVDTENESKSWTKMDLLLLVFGSLIHLGDGVEIYLPGKLFKWIYTVELLQIEMIG